MGRDKGLLFSGDKSWFELAKDKLESLGLEAWISINRSQYPCYKKVLPCNRFILDSEAINVKGPMLGILSSHIRFPEDDILVLASDLLQMDTALLKNLTERKKTDKTAQAVLYRIEGELQPLCAIYSAVGLTSFLSTVNSGRLENFSMKNLLSKFHIAEMECVEKEIKAFKNFNSPSELSNS